MPYEATVDDDDLPDFDPVDLARLLVGIEERFRRPARIDTPEEIRAWLAERDHRPDVQP
ncbi:hypothetical protein [Spongiactinospora sp. TRM90649]|uniref:hypothetical protein n=1 Tax=Spongiactinospora sp. TRM90649 TaxID=3031114 RepID=UPI0023F63189|nr:hypothetical protein [Spongiactinospora sp. TRM90649]MDF5758647.1 hypothetical protein [Spongiactinospora sp. TRM90649]